MSNLSQFFGGGGASNRIIPINFLVVGGGGGSGSIHGTPINSGPNITKERSGSSGSGGGGSVYYGNAYFTEPGVVLSVIVGSGGAGGVGSYPGQWNRGSDGGTSSLTDPTGDFFSAEGGGGGGIGGDVSIPMPQFQTYSPGSNGGTGGGAGRQAVPSTPFNSWGNTGVGKFYRRFNYSPSPTLINEIDDQELLDTGYGYIGGFPGGFGFPYPGAYNNSIYSGGAGGIGNEYTSRQLVQGDEKRTGNGIASFIEGTKKIYGNGSGGASDYAYTPTLPSNYYPPTNPSVNPNPGSGFGGQPVVRSGYGGLSNPGLHFAVPAGPGVAGESGVVVVQYPTAFGPSPSFPGASNISPSTPGFRTYKFTSPGSITLP